MHKLTALFTFIFVWQFLVGTVAHAQSTTPAPATPPAEGTKEYYEMLIAKYQAEKLAREEELAATTSKFPADAVTKQSGAATITGDAQPISAQLALRAGSELGSLLGAKVNEICNAADCRVFVTTRTDVSALVAERVWFSEEIKRRTELAGRTTQALVKLKSDIRKRLKIPDDDTSPAVLSESAAIVADSLFKGAVNLLGYFKSDFDVKTAAATPDDEVVLSAITSKLRGKSVREGWSVPTSTSKSVVEITGLRSSLLAGAKVAAQVKVYEGELKDPEKAELASLAAELADHASFLTYSSQGAVDGKPGLLQRAISTDQIFVKDVTHILYAKFVQAGAMAVTRRNLFQLNPRLTFVGTATITYSLIDATTGSAVVSGTGICSWPMRTALHEIGTDLNQFNIAKPGALACQIPCP